MRHHDGQLYRLLFFFSRRSSSSAFSRSVDGGVAHDPAVAHDDDYAGCSWAMSSSCVTMTMVMPLIVEFLEHAHDLDAGLAVEVAGRFVGQQEGRLVDQGAGDGHALLLAAGKLVGMVVGAVGESHDLERLQARARCSRRP